MTDDWIFSDEAHAWMDDLRGEEAYVYQRASLGDGGVRDYTTMRYGWQYGLFGFKDMGNTAQEYVYVADEVKLPGRIIL